MKTKMLDTSETYNGEQLRSLWNYLDHGLLGDSMVAWVGPCEVSLNHMVDGEDLRGQERIAGALMVHFILEKFDSTLLAAVALQRLLASTVMEWLRNHAPRKEPAQGLRRDGDDIFWGSKKLSISIATQSPVSSLVHFAVNVVNEGTPVETLSLKELGVDAHEFARAILQQFSREVETVREATQKVKWVR